LAYRAAARAVSAYLRAGNRDASVYAMGSLGGPDAVYGVSDVDLIVVVPADASRAGDARDAMKWRWERICRLVPPLRELVFVAVYEDHELRRAAGCSPWPRARAHQTAPAGRALFRPGPFVDPVGVAFRPGLEPPVAAWRLLAGPDRLAPTGTPEAHQRARIALGELQYWWRFAFGACAGPPGPRTAYLCVKLASEPARVWLWLVHDQRVSSRREALERGVEALPEEREAFERALALQKALPRSPESPLDQMLESFLRLTSRITEWLGAEVEADGVEEVRLLWGNEDELVLAPRARDPLHATLGTRPFLLPLVDWRAVVWPAAPDEAFAPISGSPADPATLGAAAIAGRSGPYPALRFENLLVLASHEHRRTLLRAVSCPLTDPISFALLDGAAAARFSRAPGWSIRETAQRAVAEHRAWLAAGGRTGSSTQALGLLFTAARAGLLLESLEADEPELALTASAVAESLAASGRAPRSVSESSYEAYVACRRAGGSSPGRHLAELRRCVLALPAYRETPSPVASVA
jgi:hypothetical protein